MESLNEQIKIEGCEFSKDGWDIIYRKASGIVLPENEEVHTLYIRFINRHKTMNSIVSANIYILMQNKLLEEDDCACILVEKDVDNLQWVKWAITIDGKKIQHKRIRRVSMNQLQYLFT